MLWVEKIGIKLGVAWLILVSVCVNLRFWPKLASLQFRFFFFESINFIFLFLIILIFIYMCDIFAVELLQTSKVLWIWIPQWNELDSAKIRTGSAGQRLQALEQCADTALLRLPIMPDLISWQHQERMENFGCHQRHHPYLSDHRLCYRLLCIQEQQKKKKQLQQV